LPLLTVSKKFPGYTSDNLASKGVHEVNARRFVLVSADHPIVSAISVRVSAFELTSLLSNWQTNNLADTGTFPLCSQENADK